MNFKTKQQIRIDIISQYLNGELRKVNGVLIHEGECAAINCPGDLKEINEFEFLDGHFAPVCSKYPIQVEILPSSEELLEVSQSLSHASGFEGELPEIAPSLPDAFCDGGKLEQIGSSLLCLQKKIDSEQRQYYLALEFSLPPIEDPGLCDKGDQPVCGVPVINCSEVNGRIVCPAIEALPRMYGNICELEKANAKLVDNNQCAVFTTLLESE